ncbi:MAG: MerR family transcriptional regulator [Coprobacillus sp.]
MFKISDFSNLSRISIRMLRFYDEKGILHPSIIKENGYRYYEAKQLITASHIQYLRYLGFSTDKIKSILDVYQDGKEIRKYLSIQLEDLKREQVDITEKIEALSKTINKIDQEDIVMNYKVEMKEIKEMYMMCKRDIIPTYDREDLLWNGLCSEVVERKLNVSVPKEGLSMAVFFDKGYKEKDVDIEVRVEVDGKYEDIDNIKFKTIPAVKVASITFTGGYENISDVSYHIANWISEHNCEIAGPSFCVYHVGYAQTQNPEEFITEICYPIQ